MERVLYAKQLRTDLYVAAHQLGLEIHMTNVTSVRFTTSNYNVKLERIYTTILINKIVDIFYYYF